MAIKKSSEYKRRLKEIVKQAEGIEEKKKEEVVESEEEQDVEEINIEADNIKDTIKQLKKLDREQNGGGIGDFAENIVSNKKLIKGIVILIGILILLVVALTVIKKLSINYTFGAVARGDIAQSLNYTSKLETTSTDVIVSTVASTVKNVYYQKGDAIKKGQLLLEFDPKYVENETSGYEEARKDVDDMLKLYNRKKEELVIKAPCDGFVHLQQKNVGDEITIGDILVYYVATTTFKAEYKFTYTLKTKIQEWQEVTITYNGGTAKGVVHYIQGDLVEGNEVTVGVYVTDSNVDLSDIESTAEITTYGGTIKSNGSAKFSGNVKLPILSTQSGKLVKANISEGKRISKDDILFEIDNVSIINQINELEKNKSWLTNLIESNYTSMDKYKIYSNVEGIIDTQPLTVGENVKSGQELIKIKVTDEIRANIKVTSEERDLIKIGDKVEVTTTNMKDEVIVVEATITQLEEKFTEYDSGKDYEGVITITDSKVTKEMVDRECAIRIPIAESKDTLYVPKKAIVNKDGKTYLHIPTSQEEYVDVEVKIGISSDTDTEILEGVEEGQQIRIYK